MATTLPEVLSNSSLPSTTKLAGATNPLMESRSCLRTITFLCVEGMGWGAFKPAKGAASQMAGNEAPDEDFRTFSRKADRLCLHSSQTVNLVLFSLACWNYSFAV